VLIALLVIGSAVPARSASEEEVEAARRAQEAAAAERAAALTDLGEATAAYEALNAQYQTLVFRIGQMRERIDAYEAESRRLRDQIRERAVSAYILGPQQATGAGLFVGERSQQALVARQVLAAAVAEQAAALSDVEAITAEMTRLQAELEADTERSSELRIEAEAVAARMYQLLAEKEATLASANQELASAEAALAEQRRLEEIEAQRRLSLEFRSEAIRQALLNPAAGVPDEVTPGFVCPVAGANTYVDSWAAPRSGGRLHQGTDLMAGKDAPLVAAADGVVEHKTSALGGIVAVLHADYGVVYFYAHLSSYAGQSSGQWVAAGTVIGYNGDTGNPAPGAYHLHFEIRPTGGQAVNPYPTLARHGC
jgi:murein DD-endopeptidase MepM/ murein hydrolase activator NlpD